MDRARFEAIIAAYGAEPRRWPESERQEAQAYYAAARDDISDAAALDAALDEVREAPDAALLGARILKQRKSMLGLPTQQARWALAACALVGVVVGFGAGAAATQVEPTQIIGAALDAPFEAAEDFGG